MTLRIWMLLAAAVATVVAPVADAQQEDTMVSPEYIVVAHMKGALALQVSSIDGLWYRPVSEGKSSQLRITSRSLSEAKILGSADADALWSAFQNRGSEFLFVTHMGGTLAIPRTQLRTAYFSEGDSTPQLRLMYDGDPSGKTLEGEEAVRIWDEIRR